MLAESQLRDLKWPFALITTGFAGVITLFASDARVTGWKWAVAVAPLVAGVVWGVAAIWRRGDATVAAPRGSSRSFLTDVVIPIVAAVIGSGSIFWWLDRPVVEAEQVRACEKQHGLEQAQGDVRKLPLMDLDRRIVAYSRVAISSCEWPPPGYADEDGFARIVMTTAEGPGTNEATSATIVDRYVSDCAKLELAYSTGSQGAFSHLPPFVVERGAVVDAWEGKPWTYAGDVYPYPGRTEIVVVRNSKIGPDLEAIRCVS